MKSSTFFSLHPHRDGVCRDGITLVEVVAALALAASSLTGVLIAYGKAVRQQRTARQRVEAVQIADELLAGWFAPDGVLPMPESIQMPVTGIVKGDERWSWRVSKVEGTAKPRPTSGQPFVVSTYRLEVLANANGQIPQQTLLTLEFAGSIEPVAAALTRSSP